MDKKRSPHRLSRSLCVGLLLSLLPSCQRASQTPRPGAEKDPAGLIIPTQPLPPIGSSGNEVKWPNGQSSFTLRIKDRNYVQVQGLIAPAAYAQLVEQGNPLNNGEVKRILAAELERGLAELESKTGENFLLKQIVPELGYYTMWIPYSETTWSKLQAIRELPTPLTLEAVATDPEELSRIVRQSDAINSLIVAANAKDSTDGFSGLVRIGVTNEWLKSLDAELGERADGSLVKVGITDTGITYNHPSFYDANGVSRITYMKDFTQEGKVYFPDTAQFTVRSATASEALGLGLPESQLVYAEDVSALVQTVAALPPADGENLVKIPKGTPLVLPADVRKALDEGASVRLGLLAETAFLSTRNGASFDLNRNGKNDELMALIYVLPKNAASPLDGTAYLALDGIGSLGTTGAAKLNNTFDLRKAIALRDFNSSRNVAQSFAEKFGLAFESLTLKSSLDGRDVPSVAIALVGYDTGTHGSHVAGIIGGRKTLLNDKDLTLARGVAPLAELYSNRVCANTRGCSASAAIIDLALNAKVDVINMSLGGLSNQNDGYDSQSLLIDRLSQITNTIFIVSAGNSGPGLQTVGSPSTSRLAISVAATASSDIMGRQSQIGVGTDVAAQDQDFVLDFSSRGPLSNAGFKPNLSAPGTQLSAVSLNQAGRSGTAIYQGTSMAAPTVAGAYALLLDAARRYNRKYPEAPLPTDNMTLRRVLVGSTRAFDANTFDPVRKLRSTGQYTWIDQGTGILDVPAAWQALKALARQSVPTGISLRGKDVQPIYEARTVLTNRYGRVYDGKPDPTSNIAAYGAGLWIDANAPRPFYSVGVARRLPLAPEASQTRDEQGDLFAQLVGSAEFFKLKIEIHGSDSEWLKANTLAAANSSTGERCEAVAGSDRLTLVGQGALDTQGAGAVAGTQESVIYVCVDRQKIASLPKGDHGALIRAYRQSADGSFTEATPAFIIPIYLALPHETLSQGRAYTVAQGQVKSLGVSRNYVEVPADTSSLRVTLSVNKADADAFGQGRNCSGVNLSVYAGDNTTKPAEFANSQALNCTGPGYSIGPDEEQRSRSSIEIVAPKPGLWDMHVGGLARYPTSTYQLRVDYVKATAQQKSIAGSLEALVGNLNVEIKETSASSTVNASRSTYVLDQAIQTVTAVARNAEQIIVPNRSGATLRIYPAIVSRVSVSTGGAAAGTDLDLNVSECSLDGTNCVSVAASGGPTDVENASFAINPGKAYRFEVEGYNVPIGESSFTLNESLAINKGAVGTLTASQLGSAKFWNVSYSLDRNDPFFQNELFRKDTSYEVIGSMVIRSDELTLAAVPVRIRLN